MRKRREAGFRDSIDTMLENGRMKFSADSQAPGLVVNPFPLGPFGSELPRDDSSIEANVVKNRAEPPIPARTERQRYV